MFRKLETPQFFATMETLSEAYKEFYESECPIDAFPKAIRDVARTYSVGRNLPMELLCFCACGILSGAMGRVFKVKNAVSGGYTQNANIFVLGVGESSTGKSASIRALFSNLERRVLGEISEYQRELAKFKKTKTKRMQDELNGEENFDFEDEISDSPKPPRNPDFIVKNSTSEALIKAMEASGGEIFSVCEEARDSIYIVAGNYRKQGDDTETLNSGWCGEPIKHNRIVNGISSVPNPCISLLWMVQNDVIDNIVSKNKGSFIGSGFLGRFLYCKGAPKAIPDSKEIIPLDESAILKWETLLAETYQTRKKGLPVWFDTDQDAFEYFWDFDAFNTHLMNGKLRTQASLLGKARENAIRLAVIFAQAEGADRITANIAKRACRVVSYSICVSVVLFSSGMLPEIEHDRAKMDAMIRQNDGFYKKISFFDQYSSLRSERVEFIVHTFPSMYEIVKKGKGRYVVLKDRIAEAKQALGIEINDDDDLF